MRSRLAVLAAILALPGCGLLTHGTSQKVTVKSNPPGAEFQFDGNGPVYRTPHTQDLPRHEHSVKFKAMKGYKETDKVLRTRTSSTFYWSLLMGVIAGSIDWIAGAWQEFETLEDGTTVVFDLEPSEENPAGLVRFSTNPPGASIEIDGVTHPGKTGVKSQATPITVFWKEGQLEKTVVLRLFNFKDKSVTLRRTDRILDAELTPNPQTVRVLLESHPVGAEVLVDDKPSGTTPFVHEFVFEAGDTMPRRIEFRKDRYVSDKRFSVSVGDKNVSTLTGLLVPRKETTTLRVNCSPAGADIEVDDNRWAEGPAVLPLEWSVEKKSYKIRISRPGYESQEYLVDESKKDVPLDIRLKLALPRLP